MRRRTLGRVGFVAAALVTAIGVTSSAASAATTPNPGNAKAGPGAETSVTPASGPATRPGASASANPAASSSSPVDGDVCADVFLVRAPAGDSVGQLCTDVTNDGTTIDDVTITFLPTSSCSGTVTLRVSGADQSGAEFGEVQTVSCSGGGAKASFSPVSEVAADTYICGTLLSDTYTAAEACVLIS